LQAPPWLFARRSLFDLQSRAVAPREGHVFDLDFVASAVLAKVASVGFVPLDAASLHPVKFEPTKAL
jgi:hypothetical protein